MRQMSRGNSSIAWFKLAEVIMRGEKERALSIYRLLMHSVANDAIKMQLEGDILSIFNDTNAFQSYAKAATLHQQNNDIAHVVSLYEHVIDLCILREESVQAQNCIDALMLPARHKVKLYEKLVIGLLSSSSSFDRTMMKKNIDAVLQELAGEKTVSRFLTKLASLDSQMHAYACEYLTSSSASGN